MKAQIIISVLFFIVLGIIANIYVLKLATMSWIGLMLIALIILGLIGNFVGKANKKRKGIQGEPDAFIFPDGTAKKMKKMDLGIQYEASVLSSALLILGIILFLIYYIFFTNSPWIMKGLIIFNSICGIGLMFGMLVTYYQQLVSYRESTKFLKDFANGQKQKQVQKQRQYPPPTRQQKQLPSKQVYEEYSPEPYEEYYEEEPYYEPYDRQMKGGTENG